MKTFIKILKYFAFAFCFFIVLFALFYWFLLVYTKIPYPKVEDIAIEDLKREKIGDNHYRIGNNWLKLNEYGVWEMYVEGDAYERGLIYGVLAKELVQTHEDYFIAQIDKIIPSRFYFHFLRMMIAWFNKDIDHHIPAEYLEEIYGISQSFSSDYDILGNKYVRILNYHAAHDIGHALADYAMVGCTSFAVNDSLSADGELLIGRNFDFYMGDNFAKNKLVTIVNPNKGHQFLMYSWAGLAGVVSGMNEYGLTVTLNASKSDLPTESKTPISILAREILQYASTIEEAITIANKRETFVSESLMIGSAKDNKTIIIEKTPLKQAVYTTQTDVLVCSNHYQSEFFKNDSVNLWNIKNSDSDYRKQRVNELLSEKYPIDLFEAATILRNQKGLKNKNLGLGNPKAINQLLAHHSILFKPSQGIVWVSTPPYQLGHFIAYAVKDIGPYSDKTMVSIDSLKIAADDFLQQKAFQQFEAYKITKQKLFDMISLGKKITLSQSEIDAFITNNPDSYITYLTLGDYYFKLKDKVLAKKNYKLALSKEVASLIEQESIKDKINLCK